MISRSVIFLFLLFMVFDAFADTPIVYSRCERTQSPWEFTADIVKGGETVSVTKDFYHMDAYDELADITNLVSDFTAPCDLVHRDSEGVETVIYNCSSLPDNDTCAALDPKMTYDGNKVLFSLYKGSIYYAKYKVYHGQLDPDADNFYTQVPGWQTTNVKRLSTDGAHIMVYDIPGDSLADVTEFTSGIYDIAPLPLPEGRVTFVSNRDQSKAALVFKQTQVRDAMLWYSVDMDGKNMVLNSTHRFAREMHGLVEKDTGQLIFTSHQLTGGILFRHSNSGPGLFGTTDNFGFLWKQSPHGGDSFPSFGQHGGSTPDDVGASYSTIRFPTQMTNGDIVFDSYYRANSSGLGFLLSYELPPEGKEGNDPALVENIAEVYSPAVKTLLTPWADAKDKISQTPPDFPGTLRTSPAGYGHMALYGKVGHPAALPSNELMLTYGSGGCNIVFVGDPFVAIGVPAPSEVLGSDTSMLATEFYRELEEAIAGNVPSFSGNIPGCDVGIYAASELPITSPESLVKIVDSPDWHEFLPVAAVPYIDIYGVAAPPIVQRQDLTDSHPALSAGEPFFLFGAASITDREDDPHQEIDTGLKAFHQQGTRMLENVEDDDIAGISLIAVVPNDAGVGRASMNNVFGGRLVEIGQISVDNRDEEGDLIMEPGGGGHRDTSFLVKLPAHVPMILQAVDKDGMPLNMDQVPQAGNPGQVKTCGGCHLHSLENDPRHEFSEMYAATAGYSVTTLGTGIVPQLAGKDENGVQQVENVASSGISYNFDDHIAPILDARCVSCHGEDQENIAAGLDLSQRHETNNWTAGTTWYRLVVDNAQTYVPFELKYTDPRTSGTSLHRPYLSKYIKAWNPLSSLLYWKAVNQRTDKKTDLDDPDDIDFGADHPTTITDAEAKIIGKWIALGSPGGKDETRDNIKPTLHLTATVADDEITALYVGTMDVGSGLNAGSLSVCLKSGETCTNIAPSAVDGGIVSVDIGSPISDVNQVIRASVSDTATSPNTTTVEFTAGYLMAMSSGEPPPPSTVQLNVGSNESITAGDTFSRTITFSDGEDTDSDGWTYDIDWCGAAVNGTSIAAGQSSFGISREFLSEGTCAVSITITDDTGETDTDGFTITIEEAGESSPLTINAGGRAFVDEGNTFYRVVSLSDGEDTDSDGWTYEVDWGGVETDSGSIAPGSTSFTISRLMADGNMTSIMDVTVTVTDAVDDVATDSFKLITRDVPRTGSVTGSGSVTTGQSYSITITSSDPGDDTVVSTMVHWGDGVANSETSHTYSEAGTYKIVVFMMDEEDMYRIGSHKVVVSE